MGKMVYDSHPGRRILPERGLYNPTGRQGTTYTTATGDDGALSKSTERLLPSVDEIAMHRDHSFHLEWGELVSK